MVHERFPRTVACHPPRGPQHVAAAQETLAQGRDLRTETLAQKSNATGKICFHQIVLPVQLLGCDVSVPWGIIYTFI